MFTEYGMAFLGLPRSFTFIMMNGGNFVSLSYYNPGCSVCMRIAHLETSDPRH